jgi:hypothetical protein
VLPLDTVRELLLVQALGVVLLLAQVISGGQEGIVGSRQDRACGVQSGDGGRGRRHR